jgi:hypothetical protein
MGGSGALFWSFPLLVSLSMGLVLPEGVVSLTCYRFHDISSTLLTYGVLTLRANGSALRKTISSNYGIIC